MSPEERVREWLEIALEDLEVARLCIRAGKFLHGAYMCQQAVEKALKACVTALNETPSPVHNLPALAREAEVWEGLDAQRRRFLRALTAYAIEARYPERKARLAKLCTANEAEKILAQSEEMVTWLEKESRERLSRSKPS